MKKLTILLMCLVVLPLVADTRSSTNGEILVTRGWNDPGFTLSWKVAPATGGDYYHYLYSISSPAGSAADLGISSFFLELGQIEGRGLVFNSDTDFIGPQKFNDSFQGVQFNNLDDLTIEFSSTLAPGWGDFGATGKDNNYAYNKGFGTNPSGDTRDRSGWVMTPGGEGGGGVATPEPGTLLILGSGLTLAALRRRKKS